MTTNNFRAKATFGLFKMPGLPVETAAGSNFTVLFHRRASMHVPKTDQIFEFLDKVRATAPAFHTEYS